MAITPTAGRNRQAAIERNVAVCWWGENSTITEKAPVALNNEALSAPNAANTAYVDMIKVSAADVVTLPSATTAASTFTVTGAITPTGGVAPIAGSPLGIWGANYAPVAATSGTSTQGIANQQWVTAVWIPANCTITGLAYLIGTTGGTDTSGTTVGTAANIQSLAFTTPYAAIGPARYWAAVQTNGTAAYIRTVPAQTSVALGGTVTNTVSVPAATITAPTGFVADTLPVISTYRPYAQSPKPDV